MHETDLEDETTEDSTYPSGVGPVLSNEREEAFRRYVESTVKYNEAIVAAGELLGTVTIPSVAVSCSCVDTGRTTELPSNHLVNQHLPRPATERRIDGSCL